MEVRLKREYRSAWHAKQAVEGAVNKIMRELIELKYAADWLYEKAAAKEPPQEKEGLGANAQQSQDPQEQHDGQGQHQGQ